MNESVGHPAIPSTRPPTWTNSTLAQVILCVAILLAFWNSLPSPFLFDDIESIPENPSIRNLGDLGAVLSPPNQSTVAGRPILNFSLALNYALDGLRVHGYHLFNIGFHILSALILFGIVRRTLELPSLAARLGRASVPLAFATSLLWALHPIQTGSVTYIIQRAESLMGLFYLLTFYCVIRAAEGRQTLRWILGAIAACALGMGTKEAMVTAPLVILLYDRIFLSDSWRSTVRRRGLLYAGLAATWIILAVTMASASSRGGTVGFGLSTTWWQYARTQFGVILHYLRLVIWPAPLVLDYGWPIATKASQILLPAIPVLGLLGLSLWALRRHAATGFLGLAFFLILAPTSSIVPIRDAAFEHRMYLPLAAVMTFVVVGVFSLLTRRRSGQAPDEPEATIPPWVVSGVTRVLIAALAVAVPFGALTAARNKDYRSEVSIWQDTVKKRPTHWRAYDVLGIAQARQNDFQGAIANHTEALRLKPDSGITYYNRGTTYLNLGLKFKNLQAQGQARADLDPSELFFAAIDDLSKSIRLSPEGDTYSNRSIAYFQVGEFAKAKADVDSSRVLGFQPHPKFVELLDAALGRQVADSTAAK
jgi:protein O-mannosyl-transferase